MRNVVGDRVKKSRRAIEALESVLVGRDIPINVRTSVLKTCILPVLTYGCEVWGMDSTSGDNKLQTILNQCLMRLVVLAVALHYPLFMYNVASPYLST
jgi:hypothetical protein